MIFHENRLLANDSHEIHYLIFFENWEISQNVSSAANVIGALRVKLSRLNLLVQHSNIKAYLSRLD